ncbi:MAG: outer membrane protein assembly factor BamD [Phycisphaerales bacterium]|nr:MAG: outer membrane protein assembly factor BamD [Phycisphaerales bacterium]
MIRIQGRCIEGALLAALTMMALQAAYAQQPRARTLTYDADRKEWVEHPPPAPGTAEGDLHAIRAQIKQGEYRPAFSAITEFTESYGESNPLWPEARLASAEVLIGRREYHKAHIVLQESLARFGGTTLTSEVLRLEFIIAEAYLSGVKRKVWGVRLLSGEDVAFRILDEISANYPESRLAELAIKTKADHLFKNGEHALAELEYGRLLRDYPQSRYHQFALRRSADATMASFAGVDYDEAALVEAQERYREYLLRYPQDRDRDDVERFLSAIDVARAEKDFSVGEYYERTNHIGSAIFYYQLVRDNWPETSAATKAIARLELLGASDAVGAKEASDK